MSRDSDTQPIPRSRLAEGTSVVVRLGVIVSAIIACSVCTLTFMLSRIESVRDDLFEFKSQLRIQAQVQAEQIAHLKDLVAELRAEAKANRKP